MTTNLYDQLAGHIVEAIEGGSLRAGQKVPSVRRFSAQRNVSISTVLQAYRVLEDAGWIESRPQSGYYVRQRLDQCTCPEPETSSPPGDPGLVSISDLAAQVLSVASNPGLVAMGAALPGKGLLPTKALNQTLLAIARNHPELGASIDTPPGCEALRQVIARRSIDMGCHLAPDDIVITFGATEALNLSLRAITQPGDTVILESPTYYGALQIIESLGLRALELPAHPREGISLSALEYALEQQEVKACLLMPNLCNPLGSSMPEANKRRLAEILGAAGVPLIEDDTYGDLCFGSERPTTVKSYDPENVLLCASFSKTLAPGYRVGWVAGGRYARAIERMKLTGNVASPGLQPLAIAEFLNNGGYDRYLRRVRRTYQEQLAAMTEAVVAHFPGGTKVTRPQGAFVLWVEMPEGVNSLDLFAAALRENISIAPGPLFSAKGKYMNCIRLNCGLEWSSEIERAVETLGTLAAAMQKRR